GGGKGELAVPGPDGEQVPRAGGHREDAAHVDGNADELAQRGRGGLPRLPGEPARRDHGRAQPPARARNPVRAAAPGPRSRVSADVAGLSGTGIGGEMDTEGSYQISSSLGGDRSPITLAGRGERLAAVLIDGVIGLVWVVPLGKAMGIWDYAMNGKAVPLNLTISVTFIGFVMFMAVHGYFLHQSGQTVGKKVIGIRIVTLDN